jgi:hypothetical protein
LSGPVERRKNSTKFADKLSVELPVRDEKTASRVLGSQGGQALVEYILILVVVVSLLSGVAYQFNSAFKVWANNYFGDYLACLLETGELPNVDGQGGDAGICQSSFKTFSLADGKPLKTTGGGGGGSGSGKGGEGHNGGKNGESSANLPNGGSHGSRGATDTAGARSRIGSFGGSSGSFNKTAARRKGGGSGQEEKDTYTGSTEAGDYGSGGGNRSSKRGGSVRTRLNTKFAFDKDKEEIPARRNVTSANKTAAESLSKTRVQINRKGLKKDVMATDNSGFGFGDLIRWLLIIIIIIALLVTLGGQFVQIGKASD